MNPEVIESYVDKVYAYAIRRTFTEEEAADLSQEILYTAIRELPKLRDEKKFAPWLWGLADNVSKHFRRKQGKQRAFVSYDFPENLLQEEDDTAEQEEIYASLREKIAGLSQMYRDIIILHYYDGLSTKEVSERLSIPEGTVTWRLSEARKKLKKECNNMEETALRPKQMNIDIYGSGNYNGDTIPFPSAFINDALSQNILYYCYDEAHTVEELSKLCGVPAYYIEERIENLRRTYITSMECWPFPILRTITLIYHTLSCLNGMMASIGVMLAVWKQENIHALVLVRNRISTMVITVLLPMRYIANLRDIPGTR